IVGAVGHARQAGGESTLKLRRHGYGGLGAKSSAAVHCKGARSTARRIVLRPEYRYQAPRLKAHPCAAAGLYSGTAADARTACSSLARAAGFFGAPDGRASINFRALYQLIKA